MFDENNSEMNNMNGSTGSDQAPFNGPAQDNNGFGQNNNGYGQGYNGFGQNNNGYGQGYNSYGQDYNSYVQNNTGNNGFNQNPAAGGNMNYGQGAPANGVYNGGYGQNPANVAADGISDAVKFGMQNAENINTGNNGNDPAYTNPYIAQNPYMNSTPPGGDKPVKPKKNVKKIAIISGIAVLVAAIAVCAVIFIPKLFKPKKEDIKKYITNTGKKVMTSNELTSIVGGDDLFKILVEEGGRIDFRTTHGSEQISASLSFDVKNQKAMATGVGNIDGKNYKGEFYFEDNKLYGNLSPDMTNGYYCIDIKNAFSDYVSSYIASVTGSGSGSLSNVAGLTGAGLSEDAYNKLHKVYEDLMDEIDYSKDGSKTITLGNKSRKTTKYVITIPKEALQDAASKAMDILLESVSAQLGGQTNYLGMIKSYITALISKDIKINLYEYNDAVIAADFSYDINLMGQTMGLSFDLQFTGDENPFSAMDATLRFNVSTRGAIEIGCSYDSYKTANGAETSFNIRTSDPNHQNSVTVVLSYDNSTQDIMIKTVESGHGSEGIHGKVVKNEPGSAMEIQFDKAFSISSDTSTDVGTIAEIESNSNADVEPFDLFVGVYNDHAVTSVPSSSKIVNFFTASEEEFKSLLSPDVANSLGSGNGGYDYDFDFDFDD
ncbi:hypothetical protein SAMN04487934_102101 [Eubacterium ruminantium]|nr:hypothetical protein SAMN04487934_102101 [Eubacterium ruminantium]